MNNSSEAPRVKVRINPHTGMAETVEDTSLNEDAKAKLQRTKRELREMLHGSGQIADPVAAPTPLPVIEWEEFGDDI